MSPWEKMLDDWCFEHADCNLLAFKKAVPNPKLFAEFVDFVAQASPASRLGSDIINEMITQVFGEKARFGEKLIEEGAVFSVTLSQLRKYEGWDIRMSIGPSGAFDEKKDHE